MQKNQEDKEKDNYEKWENLGEQFLEYEAIVRQSPEKALEVIYQMLEGFQKTLKAHQSVPSKESIKVIDSPLTPREREVLTLAAQGQPSKEIAYLMDITIRTVQFHMSSIFKKLNVSSRTQAVAIALEKSWISKG
ncbi:MAG: response regulator transcription factor [Halobacteriovoraceae bacterium]|nr:response regulator transcription factor [Halobacteriovoraceae bacterium]